MNLTILALTTCSLQISVPVLKIPVTNYFSNLKVQKIIPNFYYNVNSQSHIFFTNSKFSQTLSRPIHVDSDPSAYNYPLSFSGLNSRFEYQNLNDSLIIKYSIFINCNDDSADQSNVDGGGAISIQLRKGTCISDSFFHSCKSRSCGGAIAIRSPSVDIVRCCFTKCSCFMKGSAICRLRMTIPYIKMHSNTALSEITIFQCPEGSSNNNFKSELISSTKNNFQTVKHINTKRYKHTKNDDHENYGNIFLIENFQEIINFNSSSNGESSTSFSGPVLTGDETSILFMTMAHNFGKHCLYIRNIKDCSIQQSNFVGNKLSHFLTVFEYSTSTLINDCFINNQGDLFKIVNSSNILMRCVSDVTLVNEKQEIILQGNPLAPTIPIQHLDTYKCENMAFLKSPTITFSSGVIGNIVLILMSAVIFLILFYKC
ncbi:hypothetical protein TRFO_29628 [Tritrichomonas foetus]|uniref:Uncharacterized protein n=1 Tax=Tritrichomonas foetus TaxID=1144522 RepID=A0A1J4JVM7_9EUKA|nr:hypothetical protein TRFO_29628 [Tritrichomonas foetus]|eukprot:OHT03067.1 hypothetical protein TRFO_29628 [Tritrichomonas foetus]